MGRGRAPQWRGGLALHGRNDAYSPVTAGCEEDETDTDGLKEVLVGGEEACTLWLPDAQCSRRQIHL